MKSGVDQYKLWDAFLAEWPIERLSKMTLPEYSTAGNKACFVQWIETRLEDVGSIWGGSAFKFGIYHRKDTEEKPGGAGRSYSDEYAWYTKYGKTAEEAFSKVRGLVCDVANAARAGDLEKIDSIDLGDAFKWKIAFHYQNRADPLIVGIFSRPHLKAYLGDSMRKDGTHPSFYRALHEVRAGRDLLEFGKEVWEVADKFMSDHGFTSVQADAFLRERYQLFGEPTRNLAGFVAPNGRPFALRLGRKEVRLFVEPQIPEVEGVWIEDEYGPEKGRSSNLGSQAPSLDVGHPARLIQVESAEALEAFCEAYGGPNIPKPKMQSLQPQSHTADALNQILYGPPGTGKTYHAVTKAVGIIDPSFFAQQSANRSALKSRFDELMRDGRIRFVTFHQSFSYEDFVEGIRADSDVEGGKELMYRVEPGVLRQIAEEALLARRGGEFQGVPVGAKVWKISIDGSGPSKRREECFKRGEMRIGWGHVGDVSNPHRAASKIDEFEKLSWTDKNSLISFAEGMAKGDVVLCLKSQTAIQAIGIIEGEYRYDSSSSALWDDYVHVRPVKWLATGLDVDVLKANGGVRLTLKTVYQLSRIDPANALALGNLLPAATTKPAPYVLIIDEINRGNVSRIFGELITLLEESKRFGREESLSVTLPYSKKEFMVPDNLYVIGTMNTADRSLTGLDIALRRRFVFEEMIPNTDAIEEIDLAGIPIAKLLEVMNARIEALLDRDHRIGHTYFLPLVKSPTLECLSSIFQRQVLPLLQEYFFEDWERIRWVLNDNRKQRSAQFIIEPEQTPASLFGEEVSGQVNGRGWRLNSAAFLNADSYRFIIEAPTN